MLFVGTSIIHPSTEGVFLLCNILDLLIYSLERYKTAIVFGTVNTVSQSLILISRNYKDQIDIKSLCGASETSITGNVNLETGNVTLNFSGNNSAIIIW